MNSSRDFINILEKFAFSLGLNINDINLDCKSWEVLINDEYSVTFEFDNNFIFYVLSIQVEPILLSDKIEKISNLIYSGGLELSDKIEKICKFGELNILLVVKEKIGNLSSSQIEDTISSLGRLFYQVREI